MFHKFLERLQQAYLKGKGVALEIISFVICDGDLPVGDSAG
jgi:hypothetical protein